MAPLFLLSTLIVSSLTLPQTLSEQDTTHACSSPEIAQFDFWLGRWDVSWKDIDGNIIKGSNIVTRILRECVISEHFSNPSSGFEGNSYSVYDTKQQRWLQTWVDNEGSYLDFQGGFTDGKMILQRDGTSGEKPFRQRMIWYNISESELDWNWERSDDGGETWRLLWQIHYNRVR